MRRPASWCRDPGALSSGAMSTTRLAQCIPCLVGHASTVQRQLPPTGDVQSSLTRMGAAGIGVRSSGSRTRVVRGSLLADACAGGGRRMTGVGTELATICGSQHWLRATELPRPLHWPSWPRGSLLFGSGAGFSEALRGLGRGVNAAANLADDATVEVADLASRALSKSKSCLDDAYAGVDIFNVNATMSIIRFAAVTPGDIADGVVPGGGGHVPEPAAESVGSLLRTMHHPLPLLDFGNASFEERGVFHRWTGMAKGPVPGYSALTLSITGVEFDVEWSFFL